MTLPLLLKSLHFILAQSTDFEIKATAKCPGNLTSKMHIASPSDTTSGSSLHYFAHIVKVKFVLIYLLTLLNKACLPTKYSFWGSRCVSSHAPTISLKNSTFHGDFGTYFSALTSVFSEHTSSQASDLPQCLATFSISDTFSAKQIIFANHPKTLFQASNSKPRLKQAKPSRRF